MIRELQWKMLDNLKRRLHIKYEIKRLILKSITKNCYLPWTYRYFASYTKAKLLRASSFTQQKNRCVHTGRVWSAVRYSHYSRFVFRTESYQGHLPGFRRASW